MRDGSGYPTAVVVGGVQKGYTLDYSYNNPFHPHAPSEIMEIGKPKARTYQYDGNGNPLYYEESKSFRSMVWDEENRLRGINDNGKLHLYTYDHTGERAVKSSGESSTVVTNGLTSAVITHMDDYTAYVNPYFVVQKGRFTKHYFEGSSRIVSKLGEGTFHHNNRGISAGGIDYIRQSAQMQEARDRYIQGSLTPPGPPTQHGIYASLTRVLDGRISVKTKNHPKAGQDHRSSMSREMCQVRLCNMETPSHRRR